MPNLVDLPVEILGFIASHADHKTLRKLRRTSRLLSTIATKYLFQNARVSPTDKSCIHFEEILGNKDLSRLVTKVYLDTDNWNHEIDLKVYEAEENDGEDLLFPPRFMKLFGRLKEFESLKGVALRFDKDCYLEDEWNDDYPQGPEFRSRVMEAFLSSLLSLSHLPKELALMDLQNVNPTDPSVVSMITPVLQQLTSLRLNITNEHDEGNGEHDLEKDAPHTFFPELTSFWLKPTTSNLRHLTLYSTNYFGFFPKFDLRGIHFPHLRSLALGNHGFVHDSQLDWILSLGETLQELYLDDCPILFAVAIHDKTRTYLAPEAFTSKDGLGEKHFASYEKRWHDYFQAFERGLPRLQHFRYGSSPDWWADGTTPFERETDLTIKMSDDSYMVFCDGYGPSPYMNKMIYVHRGDGDFICWDGESPSCLEEDTTALEELCAKIGQRIVIEY